MLHLSCLPAYLSSDGAVALQPGDFGRLVSRQKLHGARLDAPQSQGIHRICIQSSRLHDAWQRSSFCRASPQLGLGLARVGVA